MVVVLSVVLAVFKTAYSWYDGESVDESMVIHIGIALALALTLTLAPHRWKRRVLCVTLAFLFVECTLQIFGILGVLPNLEVRSSTPYGRVYWTREGFGNDIMNRYGLYYRPIGPKRGKRIVLIGDSYVQALQVRKSEHMGVVFEEMIHKHGEKDTEVIAIGRSGCGPAQYLDMLEYACRHFAPDEVVLCFFLGNDILNCHASLERKRPKSYAQYILGPDGQLVLHSKSKGVREKFIDTFEQNHRSVLETGYRTIKSHFMTRNLFHAIRLGFDRRGDEVKSVSGGKQPILSGLDLTDKHLGVYAKDRQVPWPEAYAVAEKLLERFVAMARKQGVKVRIVTIPWFPGGFYRLHKDVSDWSTDLDTHELMLPEQMVESFCAKNNVPFVGATARLQSRNVPVEEIRSYYYYDGSGHLSPPGHRMMAEVLTHLFIEQQDGGG